MASSPEKRPRGRPRKPVEERKRYNLTLRIRDTTRSALERAAAENGRSLSEEAEALVERAFQQSGLLDQILDLTYRDPQLVALLLELGDAMRGTVASVTNSLRSANWVDNKWAYDNVAACATKVIATLDPGGVCVPPNKTVQQGTEIGEGEANRAVKQVSSPLDLPEYLRPLLAARARTAPTVLRRQEDRARGPQHGTFGDLWQEGPDR